MSKEVERRTHDFQCMWTYGRLTLRLTPIVVVWDFYCYLKKNQMFSLLSMIHPQHGVTRLKNLLSDSTVGASMCV
jgi:hypothetical protein